MRRLRRSAAAGPVGAPPVRQLLAPGGGSAVDPGDLLELRRGLAEKLAELQWDLGGMAYEMAIREHFRLDVLTRRAAQLQEVDADLGVVERLLRMEDGGAAGTCPSCGSLHSRGAVFCEQCGTKLMEGDPYPGPEPVVAPAVGSSPPPPPPPPTLELVPAEHPPPPPPPAP